MIIAYMDTLPLPIIQRGLPTLREVREQCRLNFVELAHIVGIRPFLVYCMEQGRSVSVDDAEAVLLVLSMLSKRAYGLGNVRGIRLKDR